MTPEEEQLLRETERTAYLDGYVMALRMVSLIVGVFVVGLCLIRWYW